jgi:hypothetical protein
MVKAQKKFRLYVRRSIENGLLPIIFETVFLRNLGLVTRRVLRAIAFRSLKGMVKGTGFSPYIKCDGREEGFSPRGERQLECERAIFDGIDAARTLKPRAKSTQKLSLRG